MAGPVPPAVRGLLARMSFGRWWISQGEWGATGNGHVWRVGYGELPSVEATFDKFDMFKAFHRSRIIYIYIFILCIYIYICVCVCRVKLNFISIYIYYIISPAKVTSSPSDLSRASEELPAMVDGGRLCLQGQGLRQDPSSTDEAGRVQNMTKNVDPRGSMRAIYLVKDRTNLGIHIAGRIQK